jgi:hypothetical protein
MTADQAAVAEQLEAVAARWSAVPASAAAAVVERETAHVEISDTSPPEDPTEAATATAAAAAGATAAAVATVPEPQERPRPTLAEGALIGTQKVRVVGFEVVDEDGARVTVLTVGRSYRFRVHLDSDIEHPGIGIAIQAISEDARTAFSVSSFAFLDDQGNPHAVTIPMSVGRRVVEMEVSRLWLGAGKYYVTVGASPSLNLNTYAEFFDVQWKRWMFAVQREDFTQTVVLEQPVSWRY